MEGMARDSKIFINFASGMRVISILLMLLALWSCSAGKKESNGSQAEEALPEAVAEIPAFDADSAYSYVEQLVAMGPRVPNTEAHRRGGDFISGKLREFGWSVIEQNMQLKAFDGTSLQSRNIFAQINPESQERILLLTHWDCRPWADEDPDPSKHQLPVDGANDGASGVGVLLELARQLQIEPTDKGIDLLFVDAEDWGEEGDDESWALGTKYFVENPPVKNYRPAEAILLDMVGSPDARFGYEYFSSRSNPALLQTLWGLAASYGFGNYFHTGFGGGVTDDHVPLIEAGIPAIDIIDYRSGNDYQGFDPVWHTSRDGMQNISRNTLRAVGATVAGYLRN